MMLWRHLRRSRQPVLQHALLSTHTFDKENEAPRSRLLLGGSAADDKKSTTAKKFALCTGGLLSLAGAGIIGHTHYAEVLEVMHSALLSPDAVGGALFSAGVLTCMGAVAASSDGKKEKKPPIAVQTGKKQKKKSFLATALLGNKDVENDSARFSFRLLNSDERLRDAISALDKLVATSYKSLPKDLQSKLVDATAAHEKKKKERNQKLLDERATFVRKQLDEDTANVSDLKAALRPRVFVYDFDTTERKVGSKGAVQMLEEVVMLMEATATQHDELILRVKSPGGAVTDFGLAASLVLRVRKSTGMSVTACIDIVAASGGYMLACVADRIVAAPFSMVGSVGVVAMMPNIARALNTYEVDYLQFTGGRYKRTVTPFTTPTEEAKEKLQSEIDDIHAKFKEHVGLNREAAGVKFDDVDEVATGEAWLAALAPEGLIDDLATSGEILREKALLADIILVTPIFEHPQSLLSTVSGAASEVMADLAGTNFSNKHMHERIRTASV